MLLSKVVGLYKHSKDEAVQKDIQKFKDYVVKFGVTLLERGDAMPTPFRLVEPEKFYRLLTTYGFRYVTYHSTKMEGFKWPIGIHIFWFNDRGYGFYHDYWEKKVYCWEVGCDHEYKELSVEQSRKRGISHWGMHCHVYECPKCGYLYSVDSSG